MSRDQAIILSPLLVFPIQPIKLKIANGGERDGDSTNYVLVLDLSWRFFATFTIGFFAFYLSTFGIHFWFIMCCILPALLLALHTSGSVRVYSDQFDGSTLRRVKYVTFMVQNVLIYWIYMHGSEENLSFLITWIYRTNVFEVIVDLLYHKVYCYVIPSVILLTRWYINVVKDEQFVLLWVNYDYCFVLEYTLWFIGWINHRSPEHLIAIAHALFPLFLPAQFWFSCRTFTGMFMLMFSYALKTEFVLDVARFKPHIIAFRDVYDGLYLVLFVAYHLATSSCDFKLQSLRPSLN
jgi:hypothetical protein